MASSGPCGGKGGEAGGDGALDSVAQKKSAGRSGPEQRNCETVRASAQLSDGRTGVQGASFAPKLQKSLFERGTGA